MRHSSMSHQHSFVTCLEEYEFAYNRKSFSLNKALAFKNILDVCTCMCLFVWVIFESSIQRVPDGRQPFATATCLT